MSVSFDTVIKNGNIVTPRSTYLGHIGINNGKIATIQDYRTSIDGKEIINAQGLYVIPGIVDPEAHLGTHEDFAKNVATETKAAVASGVTTWGLMTAVTRMGVEFKDIKSAQDLPSYDKTFEIASKIINDKSFVDCFFTFFIMNEEHAREIPHYAKDYGVTSYKYYLHLKSPELYSDWIGQKKLGFFGLDDGIIYLGMEQVAKIGYPGIICLHCENWEISRLFRDKLRKKGRNDIAAWSDSSPDFCEAAHVKQYAYLAKITGCPIYIQHVTTKKTIDEIRLARWEGAKIIAQTGPHYLVLSKDDWKLNVPLRDNKEQDVLWHALREGEIDCIGSDHVNTGRRREELNVDGTVWSMVSGFSSRVEAALPVMLSEGVNKGKISISRLVEVACENTAIHLGLFPQKGAICIGADADIVLVDLKKEVKVTSDMLHTSAGWSIFEGQDFKGWPVLTMLGGNVVMKWEENKPYPTIFGTPKGKYIRRKIK